MAVYVFGYVDSWKIHKPLAKIKNVYTSRMEYENLIRFKRVVEISRPLLLKWYLYYNKLNLPRKNLKGLILCI